MIIAGLVGGTTGLVSAEDVTLEEGDASISQTNAGHVLVGEVCEESDNKKRCQAVSTYSDLSSLGTTAALCAYGGPVGCGLGVTLFA
jgi:hypothetical protein